ncbi:M23 family metallopeptidase [Sphingomonas arantia]|uniref:M23 family metallopeptidase n=1 Tax=Sphingomonas arantia TaxID=1460676 RepID=A0ABW4TTJ1_9SPHN
MREVGGATATAPSDGFTIEGAVRQGGLLRGVAPVGTVELTLDGEPLAMAPDRRFLIGLDRDAPPAARLVATHADGGQSVRVLVVRRGDWRVQSLPTLPKATPRTPTEVARRNAELAQIVAARATVHATDGWRQTPVWPVTGRISGVFGSQRIYAGEPGAYHGGVDIARPTGTPVASPLDGVVVLAAAVPFSLEGHLLLIDHGMGLGSAFLHLSRIDVRVGDRVTRGQTVGAIGATGRATGPHLHWAMTWNGRRIDPQPLAGAMPTSTAR